MDGVAMLRQLIGQIQGLCELYGFPPPQPLMEPRGGERWYFLNLSNKPSCGSCQQIEMPDPKSPPPAKKPRKNTEKHISLPMEQSIWREFPDDLFESVISRLPVAAYFRLRSVCRQWNSLLCSQGFSRRCSELPLPLPWLYAIVRSGAINNVFVFDPSSQEWRRPPSPALPVEVLVPVASAGGLICLADIAQCKLFVTNPLTRSYHELPPRLNPPWSSAAAAMTFDGTHYRIMCLGRDGDLEIYDSQQGSWSRPGGIFANITLPLLLSFRSPATAIGHTVYFLRCKPEGIVSYDAASQQWQELGVPSPPHVGDVALGECSGRLLLVGLRRRNAAACVCVWELQRMTLLWKEVDRMPNVWCLEFYGREVRMTCHGNRRLLVVSLRTSHINYLISYDAVTREWMRVPAWKKKHWIACGASFQPCLSASP